MVIPTNRPLVLLGFMGSGKSTLGRQLAVALNFNFIDLDRFIETEENRKIPEIFEMDGEPVFRRIEFSALKRVLSNPRQVISIGGGAPCYPGSLQFIKDHSLSVYLKVSEQQLFQRLSYSSTARPLLEGKSESELQSYISDLLKIREPIYNQADIIIESDAITAEMILAGI